MNLCLIAVFLSSWERPPELLENMCVEGHNEQLGFSFQYCNKNYSIGFFDNYLFEVER